MHHLVHLPEQIMHAVRIAGSYNSNNNEYLFLFQVWSSTKSMVHEVQVKKCTDEDLSLAALRMYH